MATETLSFVGVTASQSSINQVFPRWAAVLGLDARLRPLDLPLDTSADRYRDVVADLRDEPALVGALVTSHKVALLEAAGDLFEDLDEYARQCHELSCIVSRDGRLRGSAKDPITSGLALEDFLPDDHFRRVGGDVICFGAGGSGLAFALHLLTRRREDDRPRRIVLVNRSGSRLDATREVLERYPWSDTKVEFVENADPATNDELVGSAPAGSLFVNATGLGKDAPGSPVSDDVAYPRDGYVWDFNYRGDLRFLQQARAQADQRGLHVEDGWRYFVYGWSAVIADVFELDLDRGQIDRLADAAADLRPRS